jgi:hypothetical protein
MGARERKNQIIIFLAKKATGHNWTALVRHSQTSNEEEEEMPPSR